MNSGAQQSQGCELFSSIVTERAKITDMDSQDPRSGCLVISCVIISILPKLSENSFLHPEDEDVCHL